jgi:hypothetical protein
MGRITLFEVRGIFNHLLKCLDGENGRIWLEDFSRFLRKENPWRFHNNDLRFEIISTVNFSATLQTTSDSFREFQGENFFHGISSFFDPNTCIPIFPFQSLIRKRMRIVLIKEKVKLYDCYKFIKLQKGICPNAYGLLIAWEFCKTFLPTHTTILGVDTEDKLFLEGEDIALPVLYSDSMGWGLTTQTPNRRLVAGNYFIYFSDYPEILKISENDEIFSKQNIMEFIKYTTRYATNEKISQNYLEDKFNDWFSNSDTPNSREIIWKEKIEKEAEKILDRYHK